MSKLVENGAFRDDLYYRLNVVKLELPPLSRRRDDIPLLVNHFIKKFNLKTGKNILGVSDEVLKILLQFDYPGNVRQLENIIEHAFVMCNDEKIKPSCLPPEFSHFKKLFQHPIQEQTPLRGAEYQTIIKILEKHNWNKVASAKELGLHRTTLWRKMKKYGIM